MFYLIILVTIIVGVVLFDVQKLSIGNNILYFICFFLLTVMSALRYRVGGDTLSYEEFYIYMPQLSDLPDYLEYGNSLEYQPLWLLLVALCKSINSEFYFFQIVHALIFNISLFYFINNYTQYRYTVLLILFLSLLYFYYSFEIQRETMALCFFLFNIKNLENNKWLNYYLLAILSFLFHISAIVLFFLPLFKKIRVTKHLIIGMLIFSMFLYAFKSIIFNIIAPFLFLESMKNKAEIYSQINFSVIGFIAFYAVRVLLFIPLLLFINIGSELKYKWFYSAFFIISIFSQYFVGMERLLNYFYPVYLLIVVEIIYKHVAFFTLKRNLIVFFSLLHIYFILDYKLFNKNENGQYYYSLFFPYESILDPKIHPDRELFYNNQW